MEQLLIEGAKEGNIIKIKQAILHVNVNQDMNLININIQDNIIGFTPLYWAIYSKNKECIEFLINNGADYKIKSLVHIYINENLELVYN